MVWDAEYTPIKPDIRRRRCSLIPIHGTVRIRCFLAKMQALVHYMKTFDAGEFVGQRLDCISYWIDLQAIKSRPITM